MLHLSANVTQTDTHAQSPIHTEPMDLSKRFFRKICQPTSCLLPPPRDPAVTSRLRKSTLYPRPILRTKRYCSTINYALLNFQWSCVSCVLFYIFTVLLFHWQCCLLISYILFCCLHCDCLGLAAIKWFLTAFETLNLLTYLLTNFGIQIQPRHRPILYHVSIFCCIMCSQYTNVTDRRTSRS